MNVTIYRRGRTYYAQVREGSEVIAHRSTRETNRKRAEKWVREKYAIFATEARKRSNPTMQEFTENFFAWNGTWSMDRRTSGKRHSERNSRERARILEKYILPEFGDRRLDEITTTDIKRFRDILFTGVGGARVHQVLVSLRQIFIAAEEAGYIDRLPRIPSVNTAPINRTGVLTVQEAARLFREGVWKDQRARAACLLAASTGMRLGEIQALTWNDVDFGRGIISVSKSWSGSEKRLQATTKNGTERRVVLAGAVRAELEALRAIHPFPGDKGAFLFFCIDEGGPRTRKSPPPGREWKRENVFRADRPCEGPIRTGFFQALASIGIDREAVKERNLKFHGLRAFANSFYLSHGVPLLRVQELVGHRSLKMSQHYYRGDLDDMADVRDAAQALTVRLVGDQPQKRRTG